MSVVSVGERLAGELHCDAARVAAWGFTYGDAYAIHRDPGDPATRALGGPIVPGRLKLAALARLVDEWLAGRGWVERLSARYAGTDAVGATLALGGEVRHVALPRVSLRLWTASPGGLITTLAEADIRWTSP